MQRFDEQLFDAHRDRRRRKLLVIVVIVRDSVGVVAGVCNNATVDGQSELRS